VSKKLGEKKLAQALECVFETGRQSFFSSIVLYKVGWLFFRPHTTLWLEAWLS
jgi:hypothetical protein